MSQSTTGVYDVTLTAIHPPKHTHIDFCLKQTVNMGDVTWGIPIVPSLSWFDKYVLCVCFDWLCCFLCIWLVTDAFWNMKSMKSSPEWVAYICIYSESVRSLQPLTRSLCGRDQTLPHKIHLCSPSPPGRADVVCMARFWSPDKHGPFLFHSNSGSVKAADTHLHNGSTSR